MKIELTTAKCIALEGYIEDLETTGLVSKDQIVSIEECLGINTITSNIHINKFTNLPTGGLQKRVVEILKNVKNNVHITDVVTVDMMVLASSDFNRKLERIINNLKRLIDIKPEVLTRLTDETYTSHWTGETVLVDVSKDEPIFSVLFNRRDFVYSACSLTENRNSASEIYESLANLELSTPEGLSEYLPLLGSLLDDVDTFKYRMEHGELYCKKVFTISDMVYIIRNINKIVTALEKCYIEVDIFTEMNFTRGLAGGRYYFKSDENKVNSEVKLDYTWLTNTNKVLGDEQSLALINMFNLLK